MIALDCGRYSLCWVPAALVVRVGMALLMALERALARVRRMVLVKGRGHSRHLSRYLLIVVALLGL